MAAAKNPCPVCSGPIPTIPGGKALVYCSVECRATKCPKPREGTPRPCAITECDIPATGHGNRKFCGDHSPRRNKPAPKIELTCAQCGSDFLGRPYKPRPGASVARYCGDLCRYRAGYASSVARGYVESRRKGTRHPCVDCGKGIWTGERCSTCWRGAVKSRRNIPATDRLATYERDGWLCKICREPVARDEKAPSPLAPTIDHVIPLVECIRRFGWEYQDGMHNWQTAHYVCNCRKGKRVAPVA